MTPDGRSWSARGECEGAIAAAPSGGGGFGYDPVFEPAGKSRSMAELPPEQKNAISHRSRALAGLREALHKYVLGNAKGAPEFLKRYHAIRAETLAILPGNRIVVVHLGECAQIPVYDTARLLSQVRSVPQSAARGDHAW